jgi:electron transfer flavoprotein beta subunit
LKIAVCITSAFEINSPLELSSDNSTLKHDKLVSVLNPFDEYAIEEAIKTKELFGGTVEVISAGTDKNTEILRKALAMGADEAILIKVEEELTSLSTALLLSSEIQTKNYDLVFMGMQTIDFQNGVVGQLTAEICGYQIIHSCTALRINGDKISGDRETENGLETISTTLPAIITTNKGINNPRYPSLKGVMAAKKKAIEIKTSCITAHNQIPVIMQLKNLEKKVKLFDNTTEGIQTLAQVLKNEGRIL